MKKKELISEILKLAPEFANAGVYFYERPVKHILSGFALDITPSTIFITTYACPLCDRVKHLHLGFGGRLPFPNGDLTLMGGTEQDYAAEFISRIQPYRAEAASRSNVDQFVQYVEDRFVKAGLTKDNYILSRAYAVTLVMLGRKAEALAELNLLCSMDRVVRDIEALADLQMLSAELAKDVVPAQDLLMEWEADSKRRLGVVSSM